MAKILKTVRKQIIRPGTFVIGGRSYTFTRDDIEHFYKQGRQMLRSGLRIPLPLEHQPVNPVDERDEAAQKAAATLHNTGWATGLYLGKGGTLYADLGIENEEAAKNIETIRFVSPRFDSFTDGKGKTWQNVITHIALTTRPVDAGQEPFGHEEAINAAGSDGAALLESNLQLIQSAGESTPWAAKAEPVSFSLAAEVKRDQHDKLVPVHPRHFAIAAKPPLSMSQEKPMPEEKKEGGEEKKGEEKKEVSFEDKLADVIKMLGERGIGLPPETGKDNFIEHLYVALHALGGEPETPPPPTADDSSSTADALMMSLEANPVLKKMVERENGRIRDERVNRINALVERGLSRAKADKLIAEAQGIQMSLNAKGEKLDLSIDQRIGDLEEALPEKDYTLSSMAAGAAARPHPEIGGPSMEKTRSIADEAAGNAGLPARKAI